MKKLFYTACIVILGISFSGCDRSQEAQQNDAILQVTNPVSAKTDKESYIRNEQTVITITNASEFSIKFGVCESNVFYYRDRLVNNQWVTWTNLICFTDDLEQYVLEPGKSLSDSIVVMKPGTYHFWYIFGRLDGSAKRDTIYSNTFTIY